MLRNHGDVSQGATVGAGRTADHLWAITARREQDEGDQEDLQVCSSTVLNSIYYRLAANSSDSQFQFDVFHYHDY